MMASRSFVLAIACVLGVVSVAQAQGPRTVRGTVTAITDSAPIADAVIRLIEPAGSRLTWSSAGGRFELAVPPGESRLLVARIGFTPDTIAVGPNDHRS
jgi:carboxypeptidase family protein